MPTTPSSNFKYFLLFAILIHGFIILNMELKPITPPPSPLKMLIILKKQHYSAPNTLLTQKKSKSNNTDVEIARLHKSLTKKFQDYAHRPRRRAISTGITDPTYSDYLEKWRRKVEFVGNQHYPEAARHLKLHGNLILQVTLTANGNLQQINLIHSSGKSILDDAAIRIVQLAAPFEPFPEAIRKETEILDITRTWQFISSIEYSKDEINDTNGIQSSFSMLNR